MTIDPIWLLLSLAVTPVSLVAAFAIGAHAHARFHGEELTAMKKKDIANTKYGLIFAAVETSMFSPVTFGWDKVGGDITRQNFNNDIINLAISITSLILLLLWVIVTFIQIKFIKKTK